MAVVELVEMFGHPTTGLGAQANLAGKSFR